jgi:hypothetical protein
MEAHHSQSHDAPRSKRVAGEVLAEARQHEWVFPDRGGETTRIKQLARNAGIAHGSRNGVACGKEAMRVP